MEGEKLIFFVNGRQIVEANADPEMTLLWYLRARLYLTGTKYGCGEGGCGACTVMVSKYNKFTGSINHISVNACLTPVCSLHGMAVTTVEGIGSSKTRLHPIQERLVKAHGSQCGFCTPGFVMSMYTLLRNNPLPDMEEVEHAFDGNLCRCTGYRPILDGLKTFTKKFCGLGENCCRNSQSKEPAAGSSDLENIETSNLEEFKPYDPTQEPIFPPDLQLNHDEYHSKTVTFKSESMTWIRPTKLEELLELKKHYPEARLVVGNTEIGVEMKFKNMQCSVLIAPSLIKELVTIECLEFGIKIGSSVTLANLDKALTEKIRQLPDFKTKIYTSVVEMLQWFGGHQIRNTACLGGNITTASPISDLNPLFLAAGAVLEVASKDGGWRTITMDHTFFKGYRKTEIKPEEVLISITIPHSKKNEHFSGFKQANRREDDIAVVNAGMRVLFEDGTNIIKELSLAFGGMAAVIVMATKTMTGLVGHCWEDDLISKACNLLAEDLPLSPGAPGGMVEFRRTLTTSFFFKFYIEVQMRLQETNLVGSSMPSSHKSATQEFITPLHKTCQMFAEVSPGQPHHDAVGRPLVHMTAFQQATGEAAYIDDIPPMAGELFLVLVTSCKAHAKILSVDPTEAMRLPGVVDFISYKDIPGNKSLQDGQEAIFTTDKVTCQGHIIGAVIADSQFNAQRGARAVKIQYEDLEPIITIKDAIAKNSYYEFSRRLKNGDVSEGFVASDHVLEGEVGTGAQEHFYLETHSAIALPKENGEMEVFSSTQNPTQVQSVIAGALAVPANKVAIRVKRIGGGFGGKESRTVLVAAPVAIAAAKHMKPVRCVLDRNEDMMISGTRHPFLGKYKVGFSNEGKILALKVDLYSNCGNSLDLSPFVMERALLHADNAYMIPNMLLTGHLCKTNIPSSTAFRGFGAPQAMFVAETWITHIANFLKKPPEAIRELNLYREGDITMYDMPVTKRNICRCWDECLKQSDFYKRKDQVTMFNCENRWKKKGIAVTPVCYGIAFGAWQLNQAGALLHVYTDGSVLLAHGGTEMGQGLHTKMIQVASRALKISASKIHISETSTVTVPNTSPSSASASSDLNGVAVMNACQTILERMNPFIMANPKGSWEEWVMAAYSERVSLSATGFYRSPDLYFDWEESKGSPFSYFTFGAACSEVEIDCLTGDHQILRTDIVMDVGCSLNPAIDIGQIEGAFIQGYGFLVLEQYKIAPDGTLITRGPGNYKIPGCGNIPAEFNVSLLKGSINKRAVYSSKAIGEPPLFLASSVFFAIDYAIKSARADAGYDEDIRLHCPATPDRIRMACQDQFTEQFPPAPEGSYRPWFVDL